MRARIFKFCLHLEKGQICCRKENQDAVINFCLLFPFFLFSISHSNAIHREICVKDFSGTTAPRILKFGTNVGYDLLYCVKEDQDAAAYHSLYLSIFLSLQANFLLQISHLLWEPVFFVTLFCESYRVETWYTYGQWVDLLCTHTKYNSQDIPVPLFSFFLSFQLAKIKNLHRSTKMFQHTSDGYGRGYVSFAHCLLYFFIKLSL